MMDRRNGEITAEYPEGTTPPKPGPGERLVDLTSTLEAARKRLAAGIPLTKTQKAVMKYHEEKVRAAMEEQAEKAKAKVSL